MWRPSCTVNCETMCTLLIFIIYISSGANASAIPTLSLPISNHQISHHDSGSTLPNSFSLIVPEGMFSSFENGTSLLRERLQRLHRIKREVCKGRPDTEVMEYYDLKLPNRCWDDCDCTSGRYCTKHSWCHDKQ